MRKIQILEEHEVLSEFVQECLQRNPKLSELKVCDAGDTEGLDITILDTAKVDWKNRLSHLIHSGRTVVISSYNVFDAVDAINGGAFGFLLRPWNLEILDGLLSRFMDRTIVDERKIESDSKRKGEKILGISSSEGILVVKESDILRIEADKNYSVIYLMSGDKVISSKTLKYFDDRLDVNRFVRVHKSHLINITKVAWIETWSSGNLRLENGDEIPVARRKKAALINNLHII